MAISTARRRGRAIPAISVGPEPELPPEPLPIGLPDLDVTSCPICARPIAVGTGRCPGCGVRLLLGVPARRAGTFVAVGLVVGLLAGGTASAVVFRAGGANEGRGTAVVPLLSPTPSRPASSPSEKPPSPRPTAVVPGQASAALAQVLVIDDRLSARAVDLRAELAAKPFDTFAVATTLRGLTADAVVGSGVTGLIGTWPAGFDASVRLGAYYRLVSGTAAQTLSASLADSATYRAGATAMLRVLADLDPLDVTIEALAVGAGLVVPPASADG
jgi:hypothetical protein